MSVKGVGEVVTRERKQVRMRVEKKMEEMMRVILAGLLAFGIWGRLGTRSSRKGKVKTKASFQMNDEARRCCARRASGETGCMGTCSYILRCRTGVFTVDARVLGD